MILNQDKPGFSDMQNAKRRFFALRNGAVADSLKRAGDPHSIIFGLTLMQLREVAQASPHNADLADRLWENDPTRESRLLAPMLIPLEDMSQEKASAWLNGVMCPEEADILCHRHLRKTDYALELAQTTYADAESDLQSYAALRLMCNIMYANRAEAKNMAESEAARNCQLTAVLACQILDELSFLE